MRDDFLKGYPFRALSEISEAVERGFWESGLARVVSDDGTTHVLPGLRHYIVMVVMSFRDVERVVSTYERLFPVLSEHNPEHMNVLVQNVHAGDLALVKGLLKLDSVDGLAAQASVAYGTAAGILRHVGGRGETFGYMSVKSRLLIESMGVIGIALELLPKPADVFEPLRIDSYTSTNFGRS